ncbi:MAG: hypothetical protein ACLR4Z_08285 [Butyricicoccaceae bacterium]
MRYSLNGHIVSGRRRADPALVGAFRRAARRTSAARSRRTRRARSSCLRSTRAAARCSRGSRWYSLLRNASRQSVHTARRGAEPRGVGSERRHGGRRHGGGVAGGAGDDPSAEHHYRGQPGVHRESVQMLESITESIIAAYEGKVRGKTSHDALRRLMDRETFSRRARRSTRTSSTDHRRGAAARRAGKSGEHLQCRRRPARHG